MSELGSATATFAYPLSASDIEFLSSVMPSFSWLDSLLAIEKESGRKRSGERWGRKASVPDVGVLIYIQPPRVIGECQDGAGMESGRESSAS